MIPALFDSLAWACAFALCLPGLRRRPAYGAVAVLVIAALLWLPVGGTSLLAVLRGAAGAASVTTAATLAALLCARCACECVFPRGERALVAALAAAAGLLFYPPALGLGAIDPYAWGYGGALMPLAVGALALAAAATGRWTIAGALTAALAMWRLQLLESTNLWDYLIDPLLASGGLIWLIVGAWRGKSVKRAGCSPAAAKSSANAGDAR
ncbi:MAG: hypothetical protein AzoDbin1_03724 [Azoarcus sp.]|nr:hypothetical protein [Azoarcus sp.]